MTLLRILLGVVAVGAVAAGDVWQACGVAAVAVALGWWPAELRRR